MALSDRLMNELRATLSGSSDAMLGAMLWNVINDACRDGHIWRETVPVDLVANQNSYVVAPAGTEVLHVFSLGHATIDFNANTALYEFGILTLTMSPTVADVAAGPIYVVTALAPALTALNQSPGDIEALIPQDMWSEHHALFYAGVMGKMMAQPAKPYSSPQLAAFHTRTFSGKLADAKHKAATGGVPGAQMWRHNNWAPRVRR